MPLEVHHVAAIVNELGAEVQIRRAVNDSLKSGVITGIATVIGGLAGGKKGVLLGAIGGGLLSMQMTSRDFVGLPTAFSRLPDRVKDRIVRHVQDLVNGLQPDDVTIIIEMAGALANGVSITQLQDVQVLRNVFDNSVSFIREQIRQEQLSNPNFLL